MKMRYLILIAVSLLLAGPLRKPLLAAWRVTLPLLVGGIVGYVVVTRVMHGVPGWMLIIGPLFAAGCLGGAIKQGLNDILGPPKR